MVFRSDNSIRFHVTCPTRLIFREIKDGGPGGEAPRESSGVSKEKMVGRMVNTIFVRLRKKTVQGGKRLFYLSIPGGGTIPIEKMKDLLTPLSDHF